MSRLAHGEAMSAFRRYSGVMSWVNWRAPLRFCPQYRVTRTNVTAVERETMQMEIAQTERQGLEEALLHARS